MSDLLALIIVACLIALTALVVRLRQDVRAHTAVVTRFLEVASEERPADTAHSESQDWPDSAALQPAQRAPAPIPTLGRWVVCFLRGVEDETDTMSELAVDSPELAIDYDLVTASSPQSASSEKSAVRQVTMSDDFMSRVPTPAVALINPHGRVEGVGRVNSAAELLHFITEGDAHGFGPRHESADHAAAHSHDHHH